MENWRIFKYAKKNFNFSYLNEKTESSIKKTILSQLIITKISNVISFLYNKVHKIQKHYTINKHVLINSLFDGLLFKIILNKINKNTIKKILKIIIQLTHTNKGKSVEITCDRPYLKWYIKKYFKRYIKIKEIKK